MILFGYCENELKKLPDNSVDLIVTSPPYAERRTKTYGGIPEDEYVEWFKPIAFEIKRVLKPTGSFFLNIKPHSKDGERSLYVFDLILSLKREVGFKFVDEYTWVKNAFPTGSHGRFKNGFEPVYHFIKGDLNHIIFNPLACGTPTTVESKSRANRKNTKNTKNGSNMAMNKDNIKDIEFARPSNVIYANNVTNQHSIKMKHSAVFPEKLVDFFVKSFSNENCVVLDPFAGSGTVGVVSIKNNRKYILIEKEKENIDLIHESLKY